MPTNIPAAKVKSGLIALLKPEPVKTSTHPLAKSIQLDTIAWNGKVRQLAADLGLIL